jgi:hypothetical protein
LNTKPTKSTKKADAEISLFASSPFFVLNFLSFGQEDYITMTLDPSSTFIKIKSKTTI